MQLLSEREKVKKAVGELVNPDGIDLYSTPDLLMATAAFMQQAGQLKYVGDFNDVERHDWLTEEIEEYDLAWMHENEVEMVDGLLDIIVIAWGTLLQRYGVEWTRALANEVARSNLDKVGPGMTIREDGKVQKPADWRPPDIAGVLAAFRAANG